MNSRLREAGFMAYRSAAHRVKGNRVMTLIGLTALSGLTAQRVGVGGQKEKKTKADVPPIASFMSYHKICVLFSQGSICLRTWALLCDTPNAELGLGSWAKLGWYLMSPPLS